MKVILLEDVKKLGKKWEVKNVSDGYARNYLIPKGVVKLATAKELENLERILKHQEAEATNELEKVESVASMVDGYELVLKAKADDKGSLYAAINPAELSKELKKAGFKVKKDFIKLKGALKETGEHEVPLEFEHGLEANIKVIVEAE